MNFRHVKVGDTVIRLLAGAARMPLKVTEIRENLIVCGDWEFDRDTGVGVEMMRHTITAQEIRAALDEMPWRQIAGSWSNDSNKTLEVNHAGMFRVTDHGKPYWSGTSILAAAAAYNECR